MGTFLIGIGCKIMPQNCDGKRYYRALTVIAGFVCVACLLVMTTPLIHQLAKPLISSDEIVKSDTIVVLSAGAYAGGLLDFQTSTRLRKVIELFRSGIADNIICLGGTLHGKEKITIGSLMRDELIYFGIPESSIAVSDKGRNTYQDIWNILKQFDRSTEHPRLLFVTSGYHTLRVRGVIEKLGFQFPVVHASIFELTTKHAYQRINVATAIAREYGALLYFWVRGYV